MSAHCPERQPSGCACCLVIVLLCLAIDAAAIYAAIQLSILVTGGAR